MTTLFPVTSQPLAFSGGADGGQPLFFDAAQTVLSQYANSPVLVALIQALNQAIDREIDFDAFYATVWNVQTAVGFGLDILGRIVGVTRALYVPDTSYLGFAGVTGALTFADGIFYGGGNFTPNYKLADEAFRKVILAKAALNITNGSTPAINAILTALFPGYGNVYVIDNRDMTMVYYFSVNPSKVDFAIASQSGVLPRPAGVSVTIGHP
jgi:hypothetical protein